MSDLSRWASCGAMALTGDSESAPLAPPVRITAIDEALMPFGLDAGVVAERAALRGLARAGQRSCGGAARLLRSVDGWLALTLARDDDVGALAALFESTELDVASAEAAWPGVEALVAARPGAEVADRAALLGVPCGVVGTDGTGVTARPAGPRATARSTSREPIVVDLSALWAGPLAASLLGRVGASVVKVEDVRRPDGARRGSAKFFDLLNGGKRSVALDLATAGGRNDLVRIVEAADIVVSSSRQRAVDQLGLDPDRFLAAGSDRIWVAITAHGWTSDRVGFGDDAAASAGLVAWDPSDGEPRFAADALADPACGVLAAHTALGAWQTGGRWFVDAPLSGAARALLDDGPTVAASRGPTGPTVDGYRVREPVARRPEEMARTLGADTETVLAAVAA